LGFSAAGGQPIGAYGTSQRHESSTGRLPDRVATDAAETGVFAAQLSGISQPGSGRTRSVMMHHRDFIDPGQRTVDPSAKDP
jgi:hypothetical protein